jgi:hypothetical protein
MLPPHLARAGHLLLAGIWALPLFALWRVSGLPWAYAAIVIAIAAATAWRAAAGLLLALVLPLGFALADLAAMPVTAPKAIEGALLAFLASASVRAAVRSDVGEPSRLSAPALSLGLIVAASAVIAAFSQFGHAGEAMREIWRQFTGGYWTAGGRIREFGASFRWLEVVALAAAAERAIRSSPSWSPLILPA